MAGPKHKKKGRNSTTVSQDANLDTSKPTAVFKPGRPRTHTLSIAIPGSIVANCQTHDLKCQLAGTIARAAAVFCVDEIVVFDDTPSVSSSAPVSLRSSASDNTTSAAYTGDTDPSHFLAHLLSYLETPPHLRKHLFPLHPDLRTAGSLPSLDLPHHLRMHEASRYREGVSVPAPASAAASSSSSRGSENADGRPPASKKAKRSSNSSSSTTKTTTTTTFADVGFYEPVILPDALPLWTRVTVELDDAAATTTGGANSGSGARHQQQQRTATPVAPSAPREQGGFYWGYAVRRAHSLASVFTESPFASGYDVSIGTSERGTPLAQLDAHDPLLAAYQHALVVFGGVAGLEAAVAADGELGRLGLRPGEVGRCFDRYVNLVPEQGSRTIRAEEAVWIGLMGLRGFVDRRSR